MSYFSEEEVRQLIAGGETSTLELKVALPRTAELAERLAGLANAQGGYLILGVADLSLEVVGVDDVKGAVDGLLRAARTVVPALRFSPPEPEIYNLEGKKVVVARVLPSAGPIYQASGVCWVRRGTHTVPLNVDEIVTTAHDRGLVRWELLPVKGATLEDLDMGRVETFLERRASARLRETSHRFRDLNRMLAALNCATEIDGEIVPTYAGLLFFGLNPQLHIPQSEVFCVLWRDKLGVEGYIDRKSMFGTLQELIDSCILFLDSNIRVGGRVVGWKRADYPDYAIEALREALVNALVHRDYSRYGERVRIFFYPDRIEIHSPGLLLPGITIEQMEQGEVISKLRNPTLADLLREVPGYMEQLGSGVRFMINETKRLGLPSPHFREMNEFVVIFNKTAGPIKEANPKSNPRFSSPVTRNTALPASREASAAEQDLRKDLRAVIPDELSTLNNSHTIEQETRLKLAMTYLHQHGSITTLIYRELTGASERTAQRDLDFLAAQGSVKKTGKTRSSRYFLP
ncbi:MAG TPA: ATP-binding protein [Chloroflexia bacterium]|nr:ATP-binding protein [Chloroflexia bacterium]